MAEKGLVWVAKCQTCGKELERCPNGIFAEGAAKLHVRENTDHTVLVGFVIDIEDIERRNDG